MLTSQQVFNPARPEDHATWNAVTRRQLPHIHERATKRFHAGWSQLGLRENNVPVRADVEDALHEATGWRLSVPQEAYLEDGDWFTHLAIKHFPATAYLRKSHEVEYTPFPDLVHEYLGHLPIHADPACADLTHRFGLAHVGTQDLSRKNAIARLWWYTFEFGLIKEQGETRVLGAGLLSSIGELERSRDTALHVPFDIHEVIRTPRSPHAMHEKYFVIEDLSDIAAALDSLTNPACSVPHIEQS